MMSRKKKILVIFHLIFAFTLLSWLIMKPYVKETVSRKSEISLYQMVFEREMLFQNLSQEDQALLIKGFEEAQAKDAPSFTEGLGKAFFVDTSVFALAWIFFSILICLLLLFQIEGAKAVAWLLPLIVMGYAYEIYGTSPPSEGLFPKESYVREHYVKNEEEGNAREKLLKGWHRYLIAEWALEVPSEEEPLFQSQLEKGLFAFNTARLKWIQEGKGDEVVLAGFTSSPSLFRILSYFLWNFLFAWIINRKAKRSQSKVLSSLS